MWLTLFLPGAVTLLVLWITVIKFLSNRKVQNLHTKYVFVTGCDSGFGRETAIRLDKMGVNVLATCLTKQGEQNLKSMTSNRLKTFQMDVTDSQQIKDVFEQVKNMLPSGQDLWGLVNNAGIAVIAPIEWTPLDHMKRIADVNLWGLIDVTKTFLPLIKKSRGRVVNLSSTGGRITFSQLSTYCISMTSFTQASAYCITKYGVEAFSDALRRELSPWGVLVSVIEPGFFKTSISEPLVESFKRLWNDLSPEMKEDYGEKFFHGAVNGLTKNLAAGSMDTYKVVDAIVDGLTSHRPQTRYAVGLEAKVLVFISYLPTFIADRLLNK